MCDTTEIYPLPKTVSAPLAVGADTVRWAEKIKKNMLNMPHRHVVFTILTS